MIRDCVNSLQWVTPQSSYLISRVRPPDGIRFFFHPAGLVLPSNHTATSRRRLRIRRAILRPNTHIGSGDMRVGAQVLPTCFHIFAFFRRLRTRLFKRRRRAGKRKEASSFVRTSPFVQSQRGPKNMRRRLSRLLAHRMPPSSAIPRRSAASDALRSLLALRRHPDSPPFLSFRAPLTARRCPRRGRWDPPWAPSPSASPPGSR